jgi:hypothetical protein
MADRPDMELREVVGGKVNAPSEVTGAVIPEEGDLGDVLAVYRKGGSKLVGAKGAFL